MPRTLLVVAAVAAALLIPSTSVLASTPYAYHTIVSRSGYASFNLQDGDIATTVWVSTTDQRMALKPGERPIVGPNALTSVEIVVQDTSQPAGKGYLTIADWFGQVQAAASFRGAMASAGLDLEIPVTDQVSGDQAVAQLTVSWVASAPATGRPNHVHIRYPWLVTINSNSNDRQRAATAVATVALDQTTVASGVVDPSAMFETVRFHCRQIGHGVTVDWGQCI